MSRPTMLRKALRRSLREDRGGAVSRGKGDEGHTLIELLIVSVILPLIVGAIAVAFIDVLSMKGTVSNRISDAADAQVVSANFVQDVRSAAQLTTGATVACGTSGSGQTQLLGLEWNPTQPGGNAYQSVVSYVKVQSPTGSTYSLVRNYCTSGPSTNPTTSTTVSSDIPADQGAPTIAWAGTNNSAAAAAGFVNTYGMTGVTFSFVEPGSNYPFSLTANPATNRDQIQATNVVAPTTTCGFANPGTGTYASQLCFVDFGSLSLPACTSSSAGTHVSAAVVNTPFTISFDVCLSAKSGQNGPIKASVTPTYFKAPTSEAFLGNNGFYMGIPGKPALYQTTEGTNSTIYFTSIQVRDANNNVATGWSLVTGDAESTDSGEAITWSTCPGVNVGPSGAAPYPPTASSTCRTSDPLLQLVANSPTSQYGNACHAPFTNGSPGTWTDTELSGIGTQTVECAATKDSDKTGTVMLQATTPNALTVNMKGSGLQAVFVGLMLP